MAYSSFSQIAAAAVEHGSIASAVLALEAEESDRSIADVRSQMRDTVSVMRDAVASGRSGDARSRSGLTGGDAAKVAASSRGPLGGTFREAVANALATAEVNAAMGRIVAAPTGGASGVLPAVVLAVGAETDASDDELADALFVASGVGSVIAAKATLSGAAAGCQAEVGSGAAMAAAAAATMLGATVQEVESAASLALQGLLGLVCDPVGGLVEVPCVHRNGTGVGVALAAAEMALAGVTFPIPFDEVVEAMASVGRSLPPSLRETARGGLAVTTTGRMLADNLTRGD